MELCLLNWVQAGGKTHNGALVKMNENKGTRGTVCHPDAESRGPMKRHFGGGTAVWQTGRTCGFVIPWL